MYHRRSIPWEAILRQPHPSVTRDHRKSVEPQPHDICTSLLLGQAFHETELNGIALPARAWSIADRLSAEKRRSYPRIGERYHIL